jgi:hypothetical protein
MRLVYIKWVDSKGVNGWTSLEELAGASPCVCESAGWVVQHPETAVVPGTAAYVIAPHLWSGKGDGKKEGADGVFVIPAGAVLEVRDLLKVPAERGDGEVEDLPDWAGETEAPRGPLRKMGVCDEG